MIHTFIIIFKFLDQKFTTSCYFGLNILEEEKSYSKLIFINMLETGLVLVYSTYTSNRFYQNSFFFYDLMSWLQLLPV